MKKEEIIESIKKIEKISNELIQTKEKIKDEELEKYFCKLEKVRMDMYDAVMQENGVRQNLDTKVDGTIKIIDTLKEKYNLILLSDHVKEWVEYILSTNQELEIFKHQYFSYEYGMLKDDEGTFKYILEKEKIIPSETIFIDDSQDNIEMANREGIQGIVFQNAKQLEYELKKMQII